MWWSLVLFCCFSLPGQGRNIAKTIGEMFGLVESSRPVKYRSRNIAIIGAGASRTGTQSLTEALQILGFPVYNLVGIAQNRSHLDSVIKSLQDSRHVPALMEQALDAGFTATLDTPMNLLWNETFQAFPNAKVLVSVRDDTETWLKSFQWAGDAFAPLSHSCPWKWLVDLTPLFEEIGIQVSRLAGDQVDCTKVKRFVRPWWAPWVSYQDSQSQPEDCLRRYYESIGPAVSDIVPPEQFLVFNVKQGWKPLCDFLGVPIPTQPFPNVNSTRELLLAYYVLRFVSWTYPFLPLAPFILFFWCFGRRTSRAKNKAE